MTHWFIDLSPYWAGLIFSKNIFRVDTSTTLKEVASKDVSKTLCLVSTTCKPKKAILVKHKKLVWANSIFRIITVFLQCQKYLIKSLLLNPINIAANFQQKEIISENVASFSNAVCKNNSA